MSKSGKLFYYLIGMIAFVLAALVAYLLWPTPNFSVLFIGNSYTSSNSLPAIFQEMAASAGQEKPRVESYAPGGYTIEQHLKDEQVRSLLQNGPSRGKKWDVVVLQEQSEMPALAEATPALHQSTIKSAVSLYRLIKDTNPVARVVLFETWARSADEWKKGGANLVSIGANPDDMLKRLRNWYEAAARSMPQANELPVIIARAGELWQIDYKTPHPVALYSSDGSHPNYAGSYLSALTMFTTVYNLPATATNYNGSLDGIDAAALRELVSRNLPLVPK